MEKKIVLEFSKAELDLVYQAVVMSRHASQEQMENLKSLLTVAPDYFEKAVVEEYAREISRLEDLIKLKDSLCSKINIAPLLSVFRG